MAKRRRKRGKKVAKKQVVKIDGLSPGDIAKLRTAIRKVWSWSYPRRLCVQRATDKEGYGRCELCKKRCPKVYADHITPCGDVDAGFIKRVFCPSSKLQALCKKCHDKKTYAERKALREKEDASEQYDLGF